MDTTNTPLSYESKGDGEGSSWWDEVERGEVTKGPETGRRSTGLSEKKVPMHEVISSE